MKLTYRPEIDGLRALAVISVIVYHAQINIFDHKLFEGGFIGVDIFFVISGYLITSIILKELLITGVFSFRHFYERRIRRILPVLLFVMLVSLPIAWLYLLPVNFIEFSKSVLFSIGFSSNFYFHFSGQIYGAENGLFKPFLHTWSLSVEEQYYILVPIILIISFKYFRKYLALILIVSLFLSLIIADWGSKTYTSATFYFLHSRMWELLSGSILAYFEITQGHRSKNKTLNVLMPYLGFFLIVHSIIFFNDKLFHPSFFTLSPIIGVCLIIWFSNKDELITKIFSSKIFVGVGLISYSLYLWHYPIFAFARISNGNFLENKIGYIVLAFFLSILSYFLIEVPARKKKIRFLFVFSNIIFLLFILIIFNYYIIIKNGFPNRLPDTFKNLRSNKECEINSEKCNYSFLKDKKIIIIGDSYAEVLAENLKKYVNYSGGTFVQKTNPCILFPTFFLQVKTTKRNICDEENLISTNFENEKQNSVFIINGALNTYFTGKLINDKEWNYSFKTSQKKYDHITDAFRKSILQYAKSNPVILIYPSPEFDTNIPKKLMSKLKPIYRMNDNLEKMRLENFISTPYLEFKNRSKLSFKILDSIKGKNIYRVYVHDKICNIKIENRCIAHDKKNIFFFDHHHLSQVLAKKVNEEILAIIKELE